MNDAILLTKMFKLIDIPTSNVWKLLLLHVLPTLAIA